MCSSNEDSMTSHVKSGTAQPKCQLHNQNNNNTASTSALSTQQRSKSLMETLLVAKMEQASLGVRNPFFRTNSVDSTGSMSSSVQSSANSEFCRCDDCLLGIGDTYFGSTLRTQGKQAKKKANSFNLDQILGDNFHRWAPTSATTSGSESQAYTPKPVKTHTHTIKKRHWPDGASFSIASTCSSKTQAEQACMCVTYSVVGSLSTNPDNAVAAVNYFSGTRDLQCSLNE